MGYSVALFGDLTFPEKAKTRWKKQSVDFRAFADWPAGFEWSADELAADYEPPTAADLLKAHVPKKAGDDAPRFLELSGEKNSLRLRALLDKSELGTYKREIVALFRSAAEVGAKGEILVLGWDDCPFDLGYRGDIAPSQSTFVALTRKEIAAAGEHPAMVELRARVASSLEADADDEGELALEIPKELAPLWRKIIAHVENIEPATLWESRLASEHLIMKKGNGYLPAAELFGSGAEYLLAVLEGSPKVEPGEATALAASAITIAATLDPEVAAPWAQRILLSPEATPELREAAADGIEAEDGDAVEALLSALQASAPEKATFGAAALLANRGAGRALGRAPFAGTGARLVKELRAIAGAKRPRKMDERAEVIAEALILVLARRKEPSAVETLHHLRTRSAVGLAAVARDALLRLGTPEALDPLAAELGVEGKDTIGAVSAVLLGSPKAAFERLSPWFAEGRRRADPMAAEIVRVTLWKLEDALAEAREGADRADPRWVEVLVQVARTEPRTNDPHDLDAQWRKAAIALLGLSGDKRAVPALLSLFGKADAQSLCDALEPMLDEASISALEDIATTLDRPADRDIVEDLLDALV